MGDSIEPKYIPAYLPAKASKQDGLALVFTGGKLLMKEADNKLYIPETNELKGMIANDGTIEYIGQYEGRYCYCKEQEEMPLLPKKLKLVDIKEITKLSGDSGLFLLAGTAKHILHWKSRNRYCGCCGHETTDKKDERAKICPNCANIIYPRISPAIITAVFRGDQILLAHNSNFQKDLYSLIAGFVEPGETLEQCVEREIREEVGIKVNNIKYLSSQPWPFPDSLMVAFTADYESGEIMVDNCEIMDASWFGADSLPMIPSEDSIAGKIIRWYQKQHS